MLYKILLLSRPRFWLYTAGPYLLGISSSHAYHHLAVFPIWYGLFYFLLPGNLFIYGINDYFDRHIDRSNPKKQHKEKYMLSEDSYLYLSICIISFLLAIPLLFVNSIATIGTLLFLGIGFFYSSPPLRCKTKPLFDSVSNMFYILPGIVSYSFFSESLPSFSIILAGALWAIAMHLFSAIVDITPDKKAGIQTSATVLGKAVSLVVTSILWAFAVLLTLNISPLFGIGIIYPLLPLLVLWKKIPIDKAYWWFPWINTILGFLLFWFTVYAL